MRRNFLGALAATAIAAGATFGGEAQATAFSGAFDPANWLFFDDGGDGAVDESGAPDSIVLVGDDSDLGGAITGYATEVTADGTFDFFWNYLSFDEDGPEFDPFGYFLNGDFFQLTDDDGPAAQSGGLVSVDLVAGDFFAFYIDSTDGCCGRSVASFGDAPQELAVPEPAALGLLGFSLLGLLAARRRAA